MARTIPPGWTQSPGCLSSADLWGWLVDKGHIVDMVGGPAAISDCYPPDYEPKTSVIYATDECPDSFTNACLTQTNGNWWSICCPTAYPFSCDVSIKLGTGTLFCGSVWPSDATSTWATSTYTQLGPFLQSLTTYTAQLRVDNSGTRSTTVVTTSGPVLVSDIRGPGSILWAMGVLISSTSSNGQDSTTAATIDNGGTITSMTTAVASQAPGNLSTGPQATPTAEVQGNGLSTGGAVGLGVGVTAAAVLVAFGGWLLYRRGVARGRRASRATPKEQEKSKQKPEGHGVITAVREGGEGQWPTQYQIHGYDHGAHHWLQELETMPSAPRELGPTPPRPGELE